MTIFTARNATDDKVLQGTLLANPKSPKAAIALVHGFGEHAGRYARVAPLFEAAGIALLGLDLHGHGRTPGPRGRVDRYERLREDVDALLEHARERYPKLPLFLWGHSMGGGLVLNYLLNRGDSGLRGAIATAPLIRAVDAPPKPVMTLLGLLRRVAPGFSIANSIEAEAISTLPEEQKAYAEDALNHDRLGVGLGVGMLRAGETTLSKAAEFPVPLLLMHSRDDKLTDFFASEAFAKACPDCNFHPFEGVEHELHNDTSREHVVQLMTQFVEAHR